MEYITCKECNCINEERSFQCWFCQQPIRRENENKSRLYEDYESGEVVNVQHQETKR